MKAFVNLKVKAQAMYFALLVATMVSLLLASFLLLTHTQTFFNKKSNRLITQIDSTNYQLLKLINEGRLIKDTLTTNTNYFTKKTSDYYGAWKKGYVSTTQNERLFKKAAFYGMELTEALPSLYLKNTNSSLIVVGDTYIKGLLYLPKQGIKSGVIAGNYFKRNQLYNGLVRESKNELPELEPEWLSYLNTLNKNNWLNQQLISPLQKEIKNSFFNTQKVIYSATSINLNEHQLSGNICVKSATKITVSGNSQLEDLLLIAPEIVIGKKFKGTIQAIATKKITIGEQVHLYYPSSIVVNASEKKPETENNDKTKISKPTKKERQEIIVVNKNAQIEGSIVYLAPKIKKKGFTTHTNDLYLGKSSIITGQVYSQGNIELLGTVNGSLYTKGFIANQYGSKYINHIYNGSINNNEIPKYSGLPLKVQKYCIAKWLY